MKSQIIFTATKKNKIQYELCITRVDNQKTIVKNVQKSQPRAEAGRLLEHMMSGTRRKSQYAPPPWLSTHGRLVPHIAFYTHLLR